MGIQHSSPTADSGRGNRNLLKKSGDQTTCKTSKGIPSASLERKLHTPHHLSVSQSVTRETHIDAVTYTAVNTTVRTSWYSRMGVWHQHLIRKNTFLHGCRDDRPPRTDFRTPAVSSACTAVHRSLRAPSSAAGLAAAAAVEPAPHIEQQQSAAHRINTTSGCGSSRGTQGQPAHAKASAPRVKPARGGVRRHKEVRSWGALLCATCTPPCRPMREPSLC